MASALGLNVGRVYVQAFAIGCFMAGLGGAVVVPAQAAVLGMGVDALILAFVVIVIGGLGSLEGALVGALIVSFVRTAGIQFFPEIELAVLYLIAAVVLLVRPTGLFGRAYEPSPAAARTGPSLPRLLAAAVRHRRGAGAAADVRRPLSDELLDLRADVCHRRARLQSAARLHRPAVVRPFRLFRHGRLHGRVHRARSRRPIDGAVHPRRARSARFVVSALFGYVCVRHTRIFFGILTLALSQVLWSLAFKFFWVTGGTDGIRVARAKLTLLGGLIDFQGRAAPTSASSTPTTTMCWSCSRSRRSSCG